MQRDQRYLNLEDDEVDIPEGYILCHANGRVWTDKPSTNGYYIECACDEWIDLGPHYRRNYEVTEWKCSVQ